MNVKMFLSSYILCVLISSNAFCDQNFVFHASKTKGLKNIEPKMSTHNKRWVYAAENIAVSAAFLGRWDDFDIWQGTCDGGLISLVERYNGAFESVYGNAGEGSIYKLSSKSFLTGKTGYDLEVVSTSKVKVIEEIKIKNTLNYLRDLSKQGKVKLYDFPNRPRCIPTDDADLIEKAAFWVPSGHVSKESFLKRHPHLKDKFQKVL